MLKKFLPDIYSESIFTINYKKLKEKGIKCILIDLDNTISPAKEVVFYKEVKELINKLKKDFKVIIFSNNFPKRVSKFGDHYDVDIACLSLKPLLYKYIHIARKYKFKRREIAAIGDQLMTDIIGANKVGFTSILVHPMTDIDETETWLNRQLEKMILKRFNKKDWLKKGRFYD